MSTPTHKRRGLRAATAGLASAGLVLTGLVVVPTASAVDFVQGEFVSPTLEGCRGDTGSYKLLKPGDPPSEANPYICDDSEYTTGNLGKGWNELDLVPHRLTTKLGKQDTATTTYDVIIAGDNSQSSAADSYEGYDRITVPTVNTILSDLSCKVNAVSATAFEPGVTGGVYDAIYRIINITQDKGTTCAFDYDMRLSNSSALYSGSSLQGYMFEKDDFSTGKRTVPIPVKEVEPQQLYKDATAVRDQTYGWTIAKEVSPNQVVFSDTCEAWESSQAITVKVIWKRVGPSAAGKIRYEATISAENPSRREVQVTITDLIYGGTDATGVLLATEPVGTSNFSVPATSTKVVGTATGDFEGNYTSIYDIATAVYWDPVLGEEITPTKTVDLAVPVKTGDTLNAKALVTDTESITTGFEFKVGASGTWGTSHHWSKEVTDSGSETFTKYVRTTQGYSGDGKLSDKATIQGELDATEQSATGATVLLAKKLAKVTVVKSTLDVFEGSESATFTFQLLSEDKLTVVEEKTMTVDDLSADDAGKPGYKKSTLDFAKVPSGIYYVRELPTTGWAPNLSDVKVDVTGTTCSAGALFTNDPSPATAKVKKVTDPVGFEKGWTFGLYKNGGTDPISTATTTDDGYVKFTAALGQGSYEVKEVSQAGWSSDGGAAACTFDVNLPGDGGKEFACTFTNTYVPKIKVEKAGDTLAKYYDGESTIDDIDYTIKVTNISPTPVGPAGAPNLVCKIDDKDIGQNKTLSAIGPGEDDSWKPSYELPADPWAKTPGEFKNTAMVTCKYGASDGPDAPVNGSTSAVSSNTWTTDVFVPSVKVTKKANVDEALVGDTVHWTVTAENTSSAKTPDLVFKAFSDSYEPGQGVTNNCTTLAVGEKCTIEYDYVVPSGSGDLDNSAKVDFTLDQTVEKWPNVISDTGRDTVDVVNPSFTVTKVCVSDLVEPGGTAKFKVTFTNNGDVALGITVTGDAADAAQIADFSLAAGGSVDKYVDVTAPALGGAATIGNKVTAKASYKTLWSDTKSADDKCKIGSYVEVVKTTVGAPASTPYNWQFRLYRDVSRSVGVGTVIVSGSTVDSGNGTIQFSALLDPTKKYTVCEENGTPSAAWTATWLTFNGNPIAAGDVWNPDSYRSIPENLGRSCVDFGAGTDYGLTANQRSTFNVENKYQYTGGQRTIGYWKNWSSCTGGNQAAVAERLGGSAAGRWLIDDVLPMTLWGAPPMPGGYAVATCEDAVSLLGKRPVGAKKPAANDAMYGMVAQLIAAKANYAAGAGQHPDVTAAFPQAEALMAKYTFDGTGSYLPPAKGKAPDNPDRGVALELASLFDWYNNGMM